jgi:hypothetical protein
MDASIARNIAHAGHVGRKDRFGEPVIQHVERVAAAVSPDAHAVAFLHDVLEHSDTTVAELTAAGATPLDLAALELLTRAVPARATRRTPCASRTPQGPRAGSRA